MKLFHKLLLLCVCAAAPILVLGTAGLWHSHRLGQDLLDAGARTGRESAETGRLALFDESRRLHSQVVERRARELQDFFERGRELVAYQTVAARKALLSPRQSTRPLYSDAEMTAIRKDLSILGKRPYAMYRLAPNVPLDEVEPSLKKLAALGDYYAFSLVETPWLKSLYIGHPKGFVLGYPGEASFPDGYDPRTRNWYKKAVRKGRVTWSSIYADKDGRPIITCAEPIYDGETLLGVSAADVAMEDFLDRLFELSELPATDALLANYKGQVRISATVMPDGRFEYRSQPANSSPNVSEFLGGVFAPAFAASLKSRRGTLLTNAAGDSVEDPASAAKGNLLSHAQVFIKTRKEGKVWHLLVRTPMKNVAGPANQVSSSLTTLQTKFSDAIDAQTSAMGIGLLLIAGAALLIAFLASWKGAQSLSNPLFKLTEIVRRIGRGDLDAVAEAEGEDEVAEVSRAVNEMTKGLKEGIFVKQTFKRFLAASVVDRIIEDPSALELGGEERDLTVFFSDMSGFTELSEKMDPKSLVQLINEYLGAMTDSIFLQEGTLDKYEGDAVMAFWGAPEAQEDHARRACWAALDNLSRLRELCSAWEAEGKPTFDIRIGINTGSMIVGNVGSKDRMEYTVLGDAVNIGSRLEQANKIYGTHILVSERTRKDAGGAVEAREIDRMALKGRKESVVVFELLGLAGQIIPKKREGCEAYAKGLSAYRAQKWVEAGKLFKEAIALLGGDKASSVMLQRAMIFKEHPPGRDWDGVFRLGT